MISRVMSWRHEAKQCLARIGRPATFKIVLKTKDDPFFIKRWIDHHSQIVSLDNLIIFDNGSTDPDVLKTYADFGDRLLVIGYDQMHNMIHDRAAFGPLYDALNSSAEYFCFLDTDEFLVAIQDGRWICDPTIPEMMCRLGSGGFIPTTWLENVAGSAQNFLVDSESRLVHGLEWGKPIQRAYSERLNGQIAHNSQLPPTIFSGADCIRFFTLHMKWLSREQRIRSNVNKLVSRGFAKNGEAAEEIVKRGVTSSDSYNIQLYVAEIASLLEQEGDAVQAGKEIPQNCIHLMPSGRIEYSSPEVESRFSAFIDRGAEIIRAVLGDGRVRQSA